MALTPKAIINSSPKLASPPSVYNKLNTLLNDANSSAENISAVINTDPALAARLLKLVNSSYYGFPSQIDTISRAITVIGTAELTNLVLATSVINSFKNIPDSLINITAFWQHSLACAIASTYLAQRCGQRAIERFFILGLLHNIGSLVLYQAAPDLARQAILSAQFGDEIIFKAEQRIIGFDHTEVGQALSQAWRLPTSIGEVIRYHHTPSKAENFPIETAVIHLADIVVSSAQLGTSGDNHVPPLDPKAWDLLGLNENILPEIVEQVNEQLDDLTSVMMSA